MSHFSVIVIGDDVEEQLAPYQEYGANPDLPKDLLTFEDCTDEVAKEWMNYPLNLLGEGGSETEYTSLEDFAKDYYGYEEHNGRYGYWHNPKSTWDWYSIGGRWTGYFPLKEGAVGQLGKKSWGVEKAIEGTADIVCLKDIDIEKARKEAETKARQEFSKWRRAFETYGKPKAWKEFDKTNIEKSRKEYHSQPAIKAVQSFYCPVETFGFDEEKYVEKCKNATLVPFAVVKDGKWHSRGEMGWFGMSNDTMSDEEWNEQFHRLLSDLPPDTILTIVDCHV